tara:strand:+ start:321 stop:647 length:327 start_codon:yes stop_codon:yes gene_type:complete
MSGEDVITAIAGALGGGGIVALIKGRWSNEAVLRRELREAIETQREQIKTLSDRVDGLAGELEEERRERIAAEHARDVAHEEIVELRAEVKRLRDQLTAELTRRESRP